MSSTGDMVLWAEVQRSEGRERTTKEGMESPKGKEAFGGRE